MRSVFWDQTVRFNLSHKSPFCLKLSTDLPHVLLAHLFPHVIEALVQIVFLQQSFQLILGEIIRALQKSTSMSSSYKVNCMFCFFFLTFILGLIFAEIKSVTLKKDEIQTILSRSVNEAPELEIYASWYIETWTHILTCNLLVSNYHAQPTPNLLVSKYYAQPTVHPTCSPILEQGMDTSRIYFPCQKKECFTLLLAKQVHYWHTSSGGKPQENILFQLQFVVAN